MLAEIKVKKNLGEVKKMRKCAVCEDLTVETDAFGTEVCFCMLAETEKYGVVVPWETVDGGECPEWCPAQSGTSRTPP